MAIDVWNENTFDDELRNVLLEHSNLIRKYVETENRIFREFDNDSGPDRPILRPENPYASAFLDLKENLVRYMQSRTIRAWHYTRMTIEEVETVYSDGIHLSTPESLATRIDRLIQSGCMTKNLAERLISASPFQSDQRKTREGKFWLVSDPIPIDDSRVTRLLRYRGGEVGSFHTNDPTLLVPLKNINLGYVLEVVVPLATPRHNDLAACSIVAAHARGLGLTHLSHAFDLYVTKPLDRCSVQRIHTEGRECYAEIGRSYPSGFAEY